MAELEVIAGKKFGQIDKYRKSTVISAVTTTIRLRFDGRSTVYQRSLSSRLPTYLGGSAAARTQK